MGGNNFAINEAEAREIEVRYLSYLYQYLAGPAGSYWFAQGADDGTRSLQQHGIDALVQKDGNWAWYENKIVHFPEQLSEPFHAFCFETLSCSISGRETNGWMHTCRADALTYAYEQKWEDLPVFYDVYVIQDMQKLKKWFWQLDLTRYRIHTEAEQNRGRSVLIPIVEVLDAFPDTARYLVFEGVCRPVASSASPMHSLLPKVRAYLARQRQTGEQRRVEECA